MTYADDFSHRDLAKIERTTQEIGRYVFDRLARGQVSIFDRRWWDDRIMAWAMQDESVKVQMFRFIDVLPMLKSSDAVIHHLHEYFDDVKDHLPSAVRLGMAVATPRTLAGRALAQTARRNAQSHARRFIAGVNTAEVLTVALRERKLKRAFTLDILGEAVTSEVEAERYFQAYLSLIRGVAPTANAWPEVAQIDRGLLAELPRVNVSVKLSALDSQFDAIDPEGTAERVKTRLRQLLRVAREHRAFVHIDMESYRTKDLTLAIFRQVLSEEEFRQTSDVGIVIQCYLRDAAHDLVVLRDWARERGTPVWVRLVKGAYWDYETIHACAAGWPIPVLQHKWESDANFERQSRFILRNNEYLRPALASHNIRSLAHGLATARHIGLPQTGLELQMLYGMADAEKQVFVDLGYRLRIYMPYGDLIPGMAYLVRRLLENTSNDSFLRASFTENIPVEKLMMNPNDHAPAHDAQPVACEPQAVPARPNVFRNQPAADFTLDASRVAMRQAIDGVRGRLAQFYPLVIDGQSVGTTEHLESIDPSHRRVVVGRTAAATVAETDRAIGAARWALPAWAAMPVGQRAEFLRRAAGAMRRRRFELAAWEIVECGKSWREADADVCEAIDFAEFYASGAEQLASPHGVDVPGEENRFEYIPRGVAAVIAPWNFPLAILTGMTTAALVTGNTVVMKPAEQSPVVAAKLMDVFAEVGLPPGVLNYLPGRGEVAGARLVEHPDVALIAFTGSRAVGLAIHARAAQISTAGLGGLKHVIAEMGGKNAIIIDDDADLDEAVLAVVASAFGYQGQKCSACSRVIVLSGVYDTFLERLVEATRSLKVGPAEDPATSVGPLIDAESVARVRAAVEWGRTSGREVLAIEVGVLADEGFFVGPHIYADVPASARLAQEEVFGPVLAVLKAGDLDEAFRIANGTEYALTGGIFSRSPRNLERARREFLVGNLYLNRGITGALVGRQPFGGFKMSGIGTKAGGADYLLQFVLPRTITENTLRRGFAPPAADPSAAHSPAE
ncbi:MAG TPA: L-glutamate gamma-semialdehyde dehydrogenase [Pirellulales bacterium]|jgi:RHH-type proline utilization regulon transcriptional repressor/proline dehydrogenase/delta 1-pyrroline-5-carboxylate dehydrogenase|nr:L-glutamate gamma-semialdehyde dehydrogenase [Pirellulales bacterium]